LRRYEYLVNQRVLEAFDAAGEDERLRLFAAFDRLAASPEQTFDFQERGASGREIRCKWFGPWLVRYWVDSPVRTVVIIDCQWT
jgi:hypothetical protein